MWREIEFGFEFWVLGLGLGLVFGFRSKLPFGLIFVICVFELVLGWVLELRGEKVGSDFPLKRLLT